MPDEIYRAVSADVELARSRSGREILAYAALFNEPYEVRDQHGHYREQIHPRAFHDELARAESTPLYVYNHGYRLDGRPDAMLSVPLGKPLEIKPDSKGLLTRAELNRSELAEAVLEAVKHGDVTGYSFRGPVHESFPSRVPGIRRGGELPLIERRRLGLADFGPTPLPVNSGARVLAVRAMVGMDDDADYAEPDMDVDDLDDEDQALAQTLADLDPDELDAVLQLADEYRGDTARAKGTHVGWDALVAKLEAQGHSPDSAARIAHAVAVRKYGPSRLIAMAQAGKRAAKKTRSASRSQIWVPERGVLDDVEAHRFARQFTRILSVASEEPQLLRAIVDEVGQLDGSLGAVGNLQRAAVALVRSTTEPRIDEIATQQAVIAARMAEIADLPEPDEDEVARAEILAEVNEEVDDLATAVAELDAELDQLLEVEGVVMRSQSHAFAHRSGPAFEFTDPDDALEVVRAAVGLDDPETEAVVEQFADLLVRARSVPGMDLYLASQLDEVSRAYQGDLSDVYEAYDAATSDEHDDEDLELSEEDDED